MINYEKTLLRKKKTKIDDIFLAIERKSANDQRQETTCAIKYAYVYKCCTYAR